MSRLDVERVEGVSYKQMHAVAESFLNFASNSGHDLCHEIWSRRDSYHGHSDQDQLLKEWVALMEEYDRTTEQEEEISPSQGVRDESNIGLGLAQGYRDTNPPLKTIGEILRDLRRASPYSQRGLAERLGVTFKEMCDLENGRTQPTEAQVRAICTELMIEPSCLILALRATKTFESGQR